MFYAKLMTKQVAGVAVLLGLLSLSVSAQDSSAQQSTPNAVSAYNEGVGLYEQGQFAKAAERFNESAKAVDRDLASRARFNLGNTHYAQALASIDSKPDQPGGVTDDAVTAGPTEEQREAAVAHLREAIQHYRSALRLNPREQDARANIELAGQMIRQLTPPPPQQQQPPETPPEESDSSESSPEDQEGQQNDDSDSSDDANKEKDQANEDQQAESKEEGKQSSDEQSSDEQSSDEQSSDEQSSDEQSSDEQSSNEQSSNEQSSDEQSSDEQSSDEQSSNEQSSNEQSPNEQSPNEQSSNEQSSDEQSSDEQSSDSTPRGELSSVNPDESSKDSPTGSAVSPQQEMGMSQEEARKLLQSIRDRDLIRRLRRQARLRSQRVPVERDW